MPNYLITGGCGFIGSCFIRQCLSRGDATLNLDALTYSGNPLNLAEVADHPGYRFVRGDIGDAALVSRLLTEFRPRAIVNFAAETHVDRSIADPDVFVTTNALGTAVLLRATLEWWRGLPPAERDGFRFHHISTDEVYGSLSLDAPAFTEDSPYRPSSPYSASKAASDHLVRAWGRTWGLPTLITNCSNNYGPRQFPEKLIPLMIRNALAGRPLPVYGDGRNVRDWLYVEDHCRAIHAVLTRARPGSTYNIGGRCEVSNLTLVRTICRLLDELRPAPSGRSYAEQIAFVRDRPGHDLRYAIDCGRIERELGWRPTTDLAAGLRATIDWYLSHEDWTSRVESGEYLRWLERNYAGR